MPRTPPARTAGQRPFIALAAAVVLAIGVPQVLEAARSAGTGDVAAGPDGPAAPSPEPGRSPQIVGPVRGADVQAYVDDRTQALQEAPDTVDTAVVSFADVLTVDDARAVLGGVGEVRAVLYRLPLPQAAARTVRVAAGDDVTAALQAELEGRVADLQRDRDDAVTLLESGTVEDEAFVAEYQRLVAELDEAIAAVQDGRLVHGVVVRAPLDALQGLVGAVGVRLVDPAPPGTDIALSVFTGLLPGDTSTVSEGRAG